MSMDLGSGRAQFVRVDDLNRPLDTRRVVARRSGGDLTLRRRKGGRGVRVELLRDTVVRDLRAEFKVVLDVKRL